MFNNTYVRGGDTRVDDLDALDTRSLLVHFSKTDLGKTTTNMPNEVYWSFSDLERTDEDMISVIEELGEEASSSLSNVEILVYKFREVLCFLTFSRRPLSRLLYCPCQIYLLKTLLK